MRAGLLGIWAQALHVRPALASDPLATHHCYARSAVIDTHCHLTFPDFAGQIDQTLARARDLGVRGCITISTTTQDCLRARDIAQAYPNVWHTSGVHPCYSDQVPHIWENILDCALSPKCVAWGELGLDKAHAEPPLSVQRPLLDEQLAFINLARQGRACGRSHRPLDLPIVLHCREAFAELIPILRATSLDPARFVFHCFTGGPDDMRALLDFGAMVSLTGVATYKNARLLHEAIRLAPLDRIMIETDSPFLSPEPKRGVRPCEPGFARYTAEAVARLKETPFEDFCRIIDANTKRCFGVEVPG